MDLTSGKRKKSFKKFLDLMQKTKLTVLVSIELFLLISGRHEFSSIMLTLVRIIANHVGLII